MSPFGVEEREEPLSVLSEPELLWFCCSDPALEVTVEEDVEEERVFSLKSVIMTVTLPTVTANCCAVLLSTFFSRGLEVWFVSLVFVVALADCMLLASLGGSFRISDFGLRGKAKIQKNKSSFKMSDSSAKYYIVDSTQKLTLFSCWCFSW